jgi:hypothetical protein
MLNLKFLICVLGCGLNIFAYSQNSNRSETVEGFKDIKLGASIDFLKGEKKLRKEIKEGALVQIYTIEHTDYSQIDEVPVIDIELKVYKNIIFQIQVVTAKNPKLMKALESRYGKAKYDGINSTYFWKDAKAILKFSTYSKNRLLLVYTSYLILNEMKRDKAKKVDDIADDF